MKLKHSPITGANFTTVFLQ